MLFGHGDDLYNAQTEIQSNYSSNVWNGADLTGLQAHLHKSFSRLTHYPEPDAASLKKLLAEHHQTIEDHIIVTNGSITAFYLIAQTWKQAISAIAIPSFAEYEDACRMHGHKLRFFPTNQPLTEVDFHDVDLCWLCCPNNPDGHYYTYESLIHLLETHPKTHFVIDQAYADFTTRRLLTPQDVDRYPNLILIRSISKAHHVPGLRIGYLIAQPTIVQRIAASLIPWSVNAIAIEAGKYILNHPEEYPLPLNEWLSETTRLREALNGLEGLTTFPTTTTFFLCKLSKGKASELKQFLVEQYGILIRDASNFRGLDERFFRLSTQSPAENRRIIEGIRIWIERKSDN